MANTVTKFAAGIQRGATNASVNFLNWTLKIFTAALIGLTVSLIAQEMIKFGSFSFVFLFVLFAGLILRIIKKWNVGSVLVFDLICVLVALLLRMYIVIAP
jgi:hypothetical protein